MPTPEKVEDAQKNIIIVKYSFIMFYKMNKGHIVHGTEENETTFI